MTGTIVDLRVGGFGFIASDDFGRPWALQFRAEAVVHPLFRDLAIGDRVQFDRVAQPGDASRRLAVRVAPVSPEGPKRLPFTPCQRRAGAAKLPLSREPSG